MGKPVPPSKQLEDAAFACTVAVVLFLLAGIIEGFDGVVETGGHTYRFLDDPTGFRGALIVRWGFVGILFAVLAIATGIGALAARGSEKASTDQ